MPAKCHPELDSGSAWTSTARRPGDQPRGGGACPARFRGYRRAHQITVWADWYPTLGRCQSTPGPWPQERFDPQVFSALRHPATTRRAI